MNKVLVVFLLIVLAPCHLAADDEVHDANQEHQLALPDDLEELADFDFDNLIKDFNFSTDSSQQTLERIQNEFWYVIVLACLSVISLLIVLHYLKLRSDAAPRDFVSAAGLSMIIFGTII